MTTEEHMMNRKGIDLDELQKDVEKLLSLLEHRERGLITWNVMLKDRLLSIHQITKQIFE